MRIAMLYLFSSLRWAIIVAPLRCATGLRRKEG
jgi:hypothetical protein